MTWPRHREHLYLSNRYYRDTENMSNLSRSLNNLIESLIYLGQVDSAPRRRGRIACMCRGRRRPYRGSSTRTRFLGGGWPTCPGTHSEAEQQFISADEIEVADNHEGTHLYSTRGSWWADWLARTGQPPAAWAVTNRNADICRTYGWNDDTARCDRVLGRLALAAGDAATAGEHLATVAAVFRDGDILTELATTLVDLAEHARGERRPG